VSIDERLRQGLVRNGEAVQVGVEANLDEVFRRRRKVLRAQVAGTIAAVVCMAGLAPWALDEVRARAGAPATEPDSSRADPGLVGTYVVEATVSGETGRWQVVVGADGVLEFRPPASYEGPDPSGSTYTVRGAVLETNAFVDFPGCQLPGAFVGRYRWERSGSAATFTRVDDSCAPRRALFEAPWEVQP
jgi:hypothetical protein